MPLPISGRTVEALRRSTVFISSGRGGRQGNGSGVALPDDCIVTNAHVITGNDVLVESWEGKSVAGKVVKIDRGRDLALLEVAGLQAPAAAFAESEGIRPGNQVIAVGHPLGFKGAVSTGTVHALYAQREAVAARQWICSDVRLAPGNSGGPLADALGRVLGINSMVIVAGGSSQLALAIPSRAVQNFLSGARRPKLGVTLRPVRLGAGRGFGLLILEVAAGAPAAEASLLPGDILTGANGRPFRAMDDFEQALAESVEPLITLHFERGREARERRVVVHLPMSTLPAAA